MQSAVYKRQGMPQADAYVAAGFKKDARDFTCAAEILQAIGVKSIRLLTDNPQKVDALTRHGVVVSGTQTLG